MTKAVGRSPAAVPERAIRAGTIHEASQPHQEWSWVEPRVWTERMLAALTQGVKGGNWYSLINIRWPTAFFAEHGLFSLRHAHVLVRQSSRRSNHQPESRMREIRPSGSEGGGGEANRRSLPLSKEAWSKIATRRTEIGYRGRAGRTSVLEIAKSKSIKGQSCRSGGCARKAVGLTPRDLCRAREG
jgi:hypothetical protein